MSTPFVFHPTPSVFLGLGVRIPRRRCRHDSCYLNDVSTLALGLYTEYGHRCGIRTWNSDGIRTFWTKKRSGNIVSTSFLSVFGGSQIASAPCNMETAPMFDVETSVFRVRIPRVSIRIPWITDGHDGKSWNTDARMCHLFASFRIPWCLSVCLNPKIC